MQAEVKAIRSKPAVSLMRAVGTVILKADDLAEAAILTALAKMWVHGKYPELNAALVEASKQEFEKMKEGEDFTMLPPPRPKAK